MHQRTNYLGNLMRLFFLSVNLHTVRCGPHIGSYNYVEKRESVIF